MDVFQMKDNRSKWSWYARVFVCALALICDSGGSIRLHGCFWYERVCMLSCVPVCVCGFGESEKSNRRCLICVPNTYILRVQTKNEGLEFSFGYRTYKLIDNNQATDHRDTPTTNAMAFATNQFDIFFWQFVFCYHCAHTYTVRTQQIPCLHR